MGHFGAPKWQDAAPGGGAIGEAEGRGPRTLEQAFRRAEMGGKLFPGAASLPVARQISRGDFGAPKSKGSAFGGGAIGKGDGGGYVWK